MNSDRVRGLANELVVLHEESKHSTVYAASVEEAIKIAAYLDKLGRSQWFRGQVKNYPTLTPSIFRLSDENFTHAREALNRFDHWVTAAVGLEDVAVSVDNVLAIAQHYGMPTTFPIAVPYFAYLLS